MFYVDRYRMMYSLFKIVWNVVTLVLAILHLTLINKEGELCQLSTVSQFMQREKYMKLKLLAKLSEVVSCSS